MAAASFIKLLTFCAETRFKPLYAFENMYNYKVFPFLIFNWHNCDHDMRVFFTISWTKKDIKFVNFIWY